MSVYKLIVSNDTFRICIVFIKAKPPNSVRCYATNGRITCTGLDLLKANVNTLANEAATYILNRFNWRAEIEGK